MQRLNRSNLIEYAVNNNLMNYETVMEIQRLEKESGKSFLYILAENEYLTPTDAAQLFKEFYNIESLGAFETIQVEQEAADLIDSDTARERCLLPIKIRDGVLHVATANPFNDSILDDLALITKMRVVPIFTDSSSLKNKIIQTYSKKQISAIANRYVPDEPKNYQLTSMDLNVQNAPAVKLTDSVIEAAVMYGASDIHVEPFDDEIRIRFRIDGILRLYETLDIKLLPSVVSRLKIMSRLNISEKRMPQDGHFSWDSHGISFRVSVMPTIYGEKAVLRLIYKSKYIINKEDLGFFPDDLEKINMLLKNPYGAILVTGPTGSGKTTTLASFANELNREPLNIVTIEDPVEIVIKGITQININLKAGLDFNNILRFVLRQDPDVLLIGEIRDSETAKTAIQAAITGHLVLTTLHTNDAVSSIIRLIDMGIESYLVPAAIKGVIAQRLVRRICPACKIPTEPSKEDIIALRLPENITTFKGCGCAYCSNTGYKGRLAVYEILLVDHKLKAVIDSGSPIEEIISYYVSLGMATMRDNALKNVMLGNTTVEEMYKVVYGV